MQIPLDEVVHFDVVTHHPTTGAITDADSVPTFSVFEEATDAPIVSAVSMTKRTSMTGDYRGTFTATAANGFEVGKFYSVVVTGLVNAITGKTVAMGFRVTAAEVVAGTPKVDVAAIAGVTEPATNLAGSAVTMYLGTCASGGTVTTIVDSGLTQSATNHWIGRVVIFRSGTLRYQATRITAFTPGTDTLTVDGLTGAPTAGDLYVIL